MSQSNNWLSSLAFVRHWITPIPGFYGLLSDASFLTRSSTLGETYTFYNHLTGLARRDSQQSNVTTIFEVICIYPISGVYTRFQRILYYFVMILTFCFRFHQGLTAAGLAFILTYSGTAAIHGFALAVQANVGHDADQIILGGFVAISAYAGFCFIMHSPRVFNLDTKPIFVTWTALLFTASIALTATFVTTINQLFDSLSYAYCNGDVCNSYCNLNPSKSLFRSHDTMVTWIGQAFSANITLDSPTAQPSVNSNENENFNSVIVHSLIPIIILDILISTSSLNIKYPPKVVRDRIVRYLTSKHIGLPEGRKFLRQSIARSILALEFLTRIVVFFAWPLLIVELFARAILRCVLPRNFLRNYTFQSSVRRVDPSYRRQRLAIFLALAWYIWGCLAYLIWPAFLLFLTIRYERAVTALYLPESEWLDAVGQWSPWVIVCLTLLAVFGSKCCRKRSKHWPEDALPKRSYASAPPIWIHDWSQGWYYAQVIKHNWEDLKRWWKDPITRSWSHLEDKDYYDDWENDVICLFHRPRGPLKWEEDLERLADHYPSLSPHQDISTYLAAGSGISEVRSATARPLYQNYDGNLYHVGYFEPEPKKRGGTQKDNCEDTTNGGIQRLNLSSHERGKATTST